MNHRRFLLGAPALFSVLAVQSFAQPFVVFPKAGQLVSPDGRFVVRNAESEKATSDFVGTFHSLWLVDQSSGRARKLCDYVGVAAVAWSDNDFLVVTQYLSKKTSRALVFPVASSQDAIMLDQPTLVQLIPPERREFLRDNDHVFVEAWRLEGDTLFLSVWGYGQHDPKGFSWRCNYALQEGTLSCTDGRNPH